MFDVKSKLEKLKIENRFFINGEYKTTKATYPKYSPILDLQIDLPSLYLCGEAEVNEAVDAAQKSYKSGIWRDLGPQKKKEVLFRLAELIERDKEEIVLLDTIETGRSIKNFYYDSLPKAVEAIRWFAEAVDKYFDHAITPTRDMLASIVKQPLGVVGIITPWNDPLVVNFWKIAPALLMGNSIVLKPAEQASYSMIKIASLIKEAGVPDGVFNLVTGDGRTGALISSHMDVRGVFFTGSSEVGKKILVAAGESNMKKVALECGGKGPFVVTKNCNDLERAAKILAKNIFYNQGQICSAPSRLIIDKRVKEAFLALLKKEAVKFAPSDPLSFESDVGSLVSKEQHERVQSYIEKAKSQNLKQITVSDEESKGYAVSPIIFDEVSAESALAKEEIFGPVLVVIPYEDIDEAIAVANNTKYGLAAAVFSDDINEANRVSLALEAGLVHINTYDAETNQMPFGGVKESGLGRDKSILAFDEFSETKTIITQLYQ